MNIKSLKTILNNLFKPYLIYYQQKVLKKTCLEKLIHLIILCVLDNDFCLNKNQPYIVYIYVSRSVKMKVNEYLKNIKRNDIQFMNNIK